MSMAYATTHTHNKVCCLMSCHKTFRMWKFLFQITTLNFANTSQTKYQFLHTEKNLSPMTHFSESLVCPCSDTFFSCTESSYPHKPSQLTRLSRMTHFS